MEKMTLERRRAGAGLLATCLLVLLASGPPVSGQSIKGGSSGANQLSSSFSQIFNSLTPAQQQQFVRQMSSSNRRILQQMLFAPQNNQFSTSFDEHIESSSDPRLQQGGTKSAKFSFQSNKASLSPVQQAQFIRSQQQIQQLQPAITSDGGSSFSSEFFSSKSVPQPTQQTSSFSRVQEVKQVSTPVVVQPVTQHSFRRVQSFTSQPVPVQRQQIVSQRFFQKHSQEQPVIPASFSSSQFSSSSSGGNVGGFGAGSDGYDASGGFGSGGFSSSSSSGFNTGGFGSGGFSSSALQQEKLDSSSLENNFGSIQQQQDNSDNVLDLSEEQQSGLLRAASDGSGAAAAGDAGLMAASFNNRWYIMKPIENPAAFGLKRVQIPESQVVNLARLRAGPAARALGGAAVAAPTGSARGSSSRRLPGKQDARSARAEESPAAAVASNGATSATALPAAARSTGGAASFGSTGATGATEAPLRSGAPPAEPKVDLVEKEETDDSES